MSLIKHINTTCPYCGVGCGVDAQIENDRLIAVAGDDNHPANRGRLCVKGTDLTSIAHATHNRLIYPTVSGKRTDWETAVSTVADGFRKTISQYGPESVAFYLSGQLLTEDYYVANKLMKGFIGSANVDTNSRLCMSSAVAAHKRAFGEDVVPCNYEDLDVCDLIVLVGSNAAWTHPIVYQRIVSAKKTRNTKVVVIDPRITSTCDIADIHLQLKPGSDTALFNGLLTYLSTHQYLDENFIAESTTGFEACIEQNHLDATQSAAATGIPEAELAQFYQLFATSDNVVTVFSQGVNQSVKGTDNGNAIINCHLATAKIGKAGCGPFSITGQPNAMGGREVGGLANQLAAHMDFNDSAVDTLKRFWGTSNVATTPGLKAVDMFDAVKQGKIKAIWIMATNPVVSLPHSMAVEQALAKCPLVVVSDCVQDNETTRYADVLLPAQAWGEKDGTVTNSERCISRQRRLYDAPGQAKPDWLIISEVARRMGFASAFDFASPAEIFTEHAKLSGYENNGTRLFDISAWETLSTDDYDSLQPQQWPFNRRPYADAKFGTPDQRARFTATPLRGMAEAPSQELPFQLNTGRVRDQWHTMTRTGVSWRMFQHRSVPQVDINEQDALHLGIATGDLITIANERGDVQAIALVSTHVLPGNLFMPIHWSAVFASNARVSRLFANAVDPISGQPESKHAAVSLKKEQPAFWAQLSTTQPLPADTLHEVSAATFWCARPARDGWYYDLALDNQNALTQTLNQLWPGGNTVHYHDQASNVFRMIVRNGEHSWSLSVSTARDENPRSFNTTEDWRALSFLSAPQTDTSRVVCTCFEVTEHRIVNTIRNGCRSTEGLGKELECGTNCGSCLPELNELIRINEPMEVFS